MIKIPRSFKLLDELNDADKSIGVPACHSGLISLGLRDPSDMDLRTWDALIFGINNTSIQDRIYNVVIIAPSDYPEVPPLIYFKQKINMPGVNQRTGQVSIPNWNRDSSIIQQLSQIRTNMAGAARMPQPPASAEYPEVAT